MIDPIRMRPPPRLRVFAALLGAAIGAVMAWRIAGGEKVIVAPKAAPPHASGWDAPTARQANAPALEAHSPNAVKTDSGASSGGSSTLHASLHTPEQQRAERAVAPSPSGEAGTTAQAPMPGAQDSDSAEQRALAVVRWDKPSDPASADRLCVAGDPVACLELAEDEDANRDYDKARAHRERAYAMLVLQCHHRSPDACVIIARMHALGLGIARDPTNERALLARARTLCKSRQGKACAALNP